jgi:ribonuclease Z
MSSVRLTLLGTGGPRPDPRRHGPAVAVSIGGERLLFDAGRGVVSQLAAAGVPVAAVNPVFLTHHHYDHIGDLADVMLTSWISGRRRPLRVYGPEGTRDIVDALVERVYARDITWRSKGESYIGSWAPVEVTEVAAGLACDGGGWRVFAEVVEHGQAFRIPDFSWVPLGYRLECAGKVVAISGDTVECDGLDRLARGADVLVQCCYLADCEIVDDRTRHMARFIHTSSSRAGAVAARAGVKTLVLTHFRAKPDALLREVEKDVRAAFAGRLVLGEDLMEIDV